MSARPFVIGLSLAATAIACGGCSHAASRAARPVTVVRDHNVITQAELQDPEIRDLTVLEVVRRLRPIFLADRGKQSKAEPESGKVHASIDAIAVLALEELSNIYARSIAEIRFLDISAAMLQFGPRAYSGPVILVRTN